MTSSNRSFSSGISLASVQIQRLVVRGKTSWMRWLVPRTATGQASTPGRHLLGRRSHASFTSWSAIRCSRSLSMSPPQPPTGLSGLRSAHIGRKSPGTKKLGGREYSSPSFTSLNTADSTLRSCSVYATVITKNVWVQHDWNSKPQKCTEKTHSQHRLPVSEQKSVVESALLLLRMSSKVRTHLGYTFAPACMNSLLNL